jgi:hypothetical protein
MEALSSFENNAKEASRPERGFREM